MTIDKFIQNLKIQTSDAALDGVLQNLQRPSGRSPRKSDIALSEWFDELSPADQEMLSETMRKSAELPVFRFLCILDGVTVIDDPTERGDLMLIYKSDSGETLVLNNPDVTSLHDEYNFLCQNPAEGTQQD